MFKKPKKNFRSRRASDDEEDNEEDGDDVIIIEQPDPAPVPTPAKKPKKKKKDKDRESEKTGKMTKSHSQSTLSFGVDEEVDMEEFQIKKSSHSRRIAKMLKREHKREKEEEEAKKESINSLAPGAGSYSAENLRQLRNEHNSRNGVGPVDMDIGSDVDLGPEERPEFDEEDPESEPTEKEDPLGGDTFRDMIAGGHIPDATVIHMAKKRRQLARERGDEFIPLEDAETTNKTGSRLIREEDHDRSDDEEDRVEFNVDKHEQDLRRMQSTILEAEQGSHSEESDHEGEWEKQQIRKGVQAGSTTQPDIDDVAKQYQQYFFGTAPPHLSHMNNGNSMPIVATRAAPPPNLPPIAIDVIRKRLTDRLDDLVSVNRAHILERDDIASRMESCNLDQDDPGSTRMLENRYRFYHEMRGYVGDLVECLAEKMTSISYLDRCMMVQWQQRADKIIQRRQQDMKDQSHQYMPKKVTGAQGVPEVNAAVEEARQRRAAEREARRSRRRRKRESMGVTDHCDGLSTDDEENKSETIKLNMERDHITTQVRTMFDNVVDDFHKLDLIKSRFEEWKYTQGDSYHEAYIGLCLPKLFTPFIKLQLILWNPLEAGCPNYEESSWYESLMFYSSKDGEDLADDDVDNKLVPSIVEKILMPKLTALVDTVWDPMSTQQTRQLSQLVRSLIQDYPTVTSDSKYTQGLIQSIGERIKKSLDDDVFMPIYPKQVLENRLSGATQFFHRQFWTCFKLFGNICEWQGILANATLQQLGLACLLCRYIVLGLSISPINSESINKCQKIVSIIPKDWFVVLDGLSTIPLLESLCRYLVGAATTLEKSAPNDKECKLLAREGMKQIRKMLISIHAMDHAANLADKTT